MMKEKQAILIGGLHRSGTSFIFNIIKEHMLISGLSNTGEIEDEGQHVQSIYPSAHKFGGPGVFAFAKEAYMDETHLLATNKNAIKIFKEWSPYLNLSLDYFVEKSPPNLIRTRFLQELYPNSKFIIILRHPIAVAYATKKWSKTSIPSLLEHSLKAYELFYKDIDSLSNVHVIRYEEFILQPQKSVDAIFDFLGLDSYQINENLYVDKNKKYFEMWEKDVFCNVPQQLERRANTYGYSLKDPMKLLNMNNSQRNVNSTISVIIPFYNTPLFLFIECIRSVKKLSPFEIILVDDCSDNSELIKFAKNTGCKYLRTPYQSGFDGLPFNMGVKEAKGDYICRVDSDDILLELPQRLEYDIHFGNADRVNIKTLICIEELILAPRAILNATIIRREVLNQFTLAEDPNVYGDILIILQLLYNKYSFDVHSKVNYIYRNREGSIQNSKSHIQHRLRLIQTVARFCSLEDISAKNSEYYMKLAMLNLKYGSQSRQHIDEVFT